MTINKAVLGIVGLALCVATPSVAKADFGFSFGYGGGCRPVYYNRCAPVYYSSYCDYPVVYSSPVVVYDRPYTSRVIYSSPRYYSRGYRTYRGGTRVIYR